MKNYLLTTEAGTIEIEVKVTAKEQASAWVYDVVSLNVNNSKWAGYSIKQATKNIKWIINRNRK
jgi:hypothetical protein